MSGGDAFSEARWGPRLLALIVAAIVAHRLFLVLSTGFVINDGGLFYAFIRGIAETFPGLPEQVAYNELSIPFAYPPLSFWIGALLSRLGADPMDVVHYLPIAMNLVYVLLFGELLRRNGASPLFVALALLFLCINKRSFEWLVMGGGMSRGMGANFLMLTLLAVRLPKPGQRFTLRFGRLVLAGFAVGGAILSHLEWGIVATASFIVSRVMASAGWRDFVRSSLVSGLIAAAAVAPWLYFVIAHHGVAPFQAASGSIPWATFGFIPHFVWLLAESLRNFLIPIGVLLLCWRRDWFWPLFFLLCVFLTPRHASTPAMLALAVFAAQGTIWLSTHLIALVRRRLLALAIMVAIVIGVSFLHIDRNLFARGNLVRPLDAGERAGMAWIAEHHPGEDFVILNTLPWWYDRNAEWFPILAKAHSVNTLQGREWLPGHAYVRWFNGDMLMKLSTSCEMLMDRMDRFEQARFVWVQTRRVCFDPPEWRSVYKNDSVEIFERT